MVYREQRPAHGPKQQIVLPLQAVDVPEKHGHHRGSRQQGQRNEILVHQRLDRFSGLLVAPVFLWAIVLLWVIVLLFIPVLLFAASKINRRFSFGRASPSLRKASAQTCPPA